MFYVSEKIKNDNNIDFLPYSSLLKNNNWLKKKYVLLRIKNTRLPNLTLYLTIYNVNFRGTVIVMTKPQIQFH